MATRPGWHDDPTSLHYWEGATWTDNRAPKPAPISAVAPPPSWSQNRKVAAGEAVAVIVGSIMPWFAITTAFGTLSTSGTGGAGYARASVGWGLYLAIAGAAVAIVATLRPPTIIA
ncbi:MAG: DUF2510 domain-containing protein [Candidatus Microthrix parvicella]|nr:DUF2510 domain-containing protein [Candidatus Microthrix sp.]MBP7879119.1 DUF2510 domain-containing protein [Candidatus Microthrix sp.]MBP8957386.1 DUF2510 domain-containing protein [Candidatus Microthrix sp.]MBP9834777.1 DUF2510 domain-containing protein [Candidatus Microthrix sp.]NLH65165.1 DUF2510 domain-containing protein [Candidatus Microthrix parvicella]